MGSHKYMFIILAICIVISSTAQLQPPPLQDFCVADLNNTLILGGSRPCINPKKVEDSNFFYGGPLPVADFISLPGLNTLGLRLNKLTFGPSEINPAHFHARAAELVYVVDGTLEAGFVTTGPNYRSFSKILKKGDVFVVPFGLVHFQLNVGKGNATAEALVFFNSERPGVTDMLTVVFASKLPTEVLAQSFQVDEHIIKHFQNAANQNTPN